MAPALESGSSENSLYSTVVFINMEGEVVFTLEDLLAKAGVARYPYQTAEEAVRALSDVPYGFFVGGYDANDNACGGIFNGEGELIFNAIEATELVADFETEIPGFTRGSGSSVSCSGCVWGGVPITFEGEVLEDAVRGAVSNDVGLETLIAGGFVMGETNDDGSLIVLNSNGEVVLTESDLEQYGSLARGECISVRSPFNDLVR